MEYLIFTFIYLLICNWFQIKAFVFAFLKPKERISIIKDKWISAVIKRKTGLSLKRIILFNSDKLFGMMPGIPWKPELILSRGLYKGLDKDELEWVILHEVGHCVLWHVVKGAFIQLFFLISGFFILNKLQLSVTALFVILLASLFISIICIQVIRQLIEYEADNFSITKVDNPKGVITAQEKFKKENKTNWFYSEQNIFRKLFYWNIYPSQRIKMAQLRLNKV